MKHTIKVLVCAATLLLMASSAMAAALGPHNQDAVNPCRICHNTPAGTPALRGFTNTGAGPATGWGAKPLSALCYYCHQAGNTYGATIQAANAYGANTHQFTVASVPEGPAGVLATGPTTGSGLPYATLAQIECTTCHNVHVVTNRPFNQRATIETLCNNCHPGRVNATVIPARSTTLAGDNRNYSTHPTTQPLSDQNRANVKDLAGIAANMRVATPAQWALGGHLDGAAGDAGNLTCQTCHAVHGTTQGVGGVNNLLAIENDTATGASTPSALCEGCHFGGAAGEQVGSIIVQAGLPAGSYSDHPIDASANLVFYPTGVTMPVDWQGSTLNNDRGATAFYGPAATGKPTCQSCHDTHGGIDGRPLLRAPELPGAAIGTFNNFSYDVWCFACHTASQVIPNNHHSVVNNLNTTLGDAISSQLSCGDCHGQAGSTDFSAHNGFWSWTTPPVAGNSLLCEGCHNGLNPRLFVSGGLKGGQNYTGGGAGAAFPATHGTIKAAADATGNASHQVDIPRDNNSGAGPNMQLTPNYAFAGNETGRTAEWGATSTPICESCHNILTNGLGNNIQAGAQGLKQGWRANLLLAPYEDNVNGNIQGEGGATDWYTNNTYVAAGTAGNTNSDFCRACHATTAALPGARTQVTSYVHGPTVHTADPFVYANGSTSPVPYGNRTIATLMTTPNAPPVSCPDVSTADAAAAPGEASYPAANTLDCDSCHRPHNAHSASLGLGTNRYLILETNTTGADGSSICYSCHNTDVQCQ